MVEQRGITKLLLFWLLLGSMMVAGCGPAEEKILADNVRELKLTEEWQKIVTWLEIEAPQSAWTNEFTVTFEGENGRITGPYTFGFKIPTPEEEQYIYKVERMPSGQTAQQRAVSRMILDEKVHAAVEPLFNLVDKYGIMNLVPAGARGEIKITLEIIKGNNLLFTGDDDTLVYYLTTGEKRPLAPGEKVEVTGTYCTLSVSAPQGDTIRYLMPELNPVVEKAKPAEN